MYVYLPSLAFHSPAYQIYTQDFTFHHISLYIHENEYEYADYIIKQ